jgi:preprotein translocase SecF subunit
MAGNTGNNVTVQFPGNEAIDKEIGAKLTDELQKQFPDAEFALLEENSVDPSMGFSFLLKCLAAVALASILMVIYVTIRFKKIGGLSAGVMALVALFHDVAMIYFLYVIFQMPIDSNFIAVVLMILGYSLNDTIVIYDRVREERRLAGPKADIADVFNHSASSVMGRTIATSITTLVAIGTVYVVALIFNLSSVQSFALPMMIGIVSGCYSSLCIAGPLWVLWNKRGGKGEKAEAPKAEKAKA